MGVARTWAEMGTCRRLKVGAVFATPAGVILSSGYNGTPIGMPHCKHPCTCGHEFSDDPRWFHLKGDCEFTKPCDLAVHAEANGISFAARQGVRLEGCVVVLTHSTCYPCAMLMVQVGISKLIYEVPYRQTEGLPLLERAGVEVINYEHEEK